MRIDAYSQISQIYGPNAKMKTSAVAKSSKTDKVEISSFGKDLQIAKKAVSESPDVRMDKVEDIKNRINNGSYEVDMDSFADILLKKIGRADYEADRQGKLLFGYCRDGAGAVHLSAALLWGHHRQIR